MAAPTTRYARSGDASIAYQVIGDGGLDLLFLTGWITQIEQLWEAPANRRFLERLAAFGRLILFDSRGTGLSDRVLVEYTVEQEARDAIAVLDAAGSERAAVITYSVGGLVGAHLAANRPDRIGALIMYASFAPSMAEDLALAEWFSRLQRLAASPSEARIIFRAMVDLDVRHVLPSIRVPTLVMHRPRELVWDVRHSRYLAEHIPGARYVELEGVDSFPFVGDSDAIVEEIEEFLTGVRSGGELTRALLTVMFTDIVDATAHAAAVGDRRWRDLLARHDRDVRRELSRFGGREVKTVGDGFLATFDGPPSGALRCALAITQAAREIGIEVRVGMHTGECELIGEDVGGMAVHIASRVCGLAAGGQVLVSGTVFGTVVGGPFTFEDRGFHELKGVPGRWPLFALGR
jgi:class 3 adenylate cyclase